MPSTVVMDGVIIQPDGKVLVNFVGGNQLEFESLAAIDEAIAEIDSDVSTTQMMALGYLKARQPDLSNTAILDGKNFTYDLSAPQPIKVQ